MKCRICENSKGLETCQVREMMFGLKESFTYFKCPTCGCLQIAEIPDDMSGYYPPEYYSYNMLVSEVPSLKSFLKKKRDRYAVSGRGFSGKMLNILFPPDLIKIYSGFSFNDKILDVGCGDGSLIWRLREAGFTDIMGIDPFNEGTIKYSNGVRVEKKTLKEMEGEWDLITYHHSFEHIATPQEEFKKVTELLSEKGRCIIRVPVVDSWAWEHYRTNWVQVDAPRHFYLHSVKSLEILAEKAGLTVEKVEYDSVVFQFWGSEQILKGIHMNSDESYYINPGKSIFRKKQIVNYGKEAAKLNRDGKGDQAVFYLKIRN